MDDDAMLRRWQHVPNLIIPTDPLSLDVLCKHAVRSQLDVAYAHDGKTLVLGVASQYFLDLAGDAGVFVRQLLQPAASQLGPG